MPRWIHQLLRNITFWVVGVLLALWFVRAIGDFLFTLFIAFFGSLALEPAVVWLHKRGWKRGLATFTIMGVGGLVGLLLLALLIPSIVRQMAALVAQLPTWLADLDKWLAKTFGVEVSLAATEEQLKGLQKDLLGVAANVFGSILGIGAAVVSGVFRLMTVGLFTFYFVADGPRFRRSVASVLPTRQQELVLNAWEVAIEKTGGYLYSRLLLAAVSAFCSWIVMSLLGIPFALPLAIWVGIISQFIPSVGTYIAMVVPLMVSLFVDPMDTLILLIFFTAYQQFENYVLSPRITAKTMELHPAIAFGAAMVGGAVAGPIGAFLALPVVATIQSGVLIYIVKRHEVIASQLIEEDQPPPPKSVEDVSLVDDVKARWHRFRRRRLSRKDPE
jgi:predicted PurR-regulated permease PerM